MKKLLLTSLALVLSIGTSFAQNNLSALPQKSQDMIKRHFSDVAIRSAEKEKDLINLGNGELYEVELSNGIKMDFNKSGDLTEIDSRNDVKIPTGVLPKNIVSYVEKNYGNRYIVSWEIDRNDQEVELSDGTDLEFDTAGNFLKVD